MKKRNAILEDHGTWLLVDISTPTHPEATMKIDSDDWEKLMSKGVGRVTAFKPGNILYAHTHINGVLTRIHREIISGDIIDHINYDGTDNRKSNLRCCSGSQNQINRPPRKDSPFGITGLVRANNRWRTYIRVSGKLIWLGYFDNIEIAMGVRRQAEEKYYKGFSYEAAQ